MKNAPNKVVPTYVPFHFDYTLEAEHLELEGQKYIGIGVTARMVDLQGNETIKYIQDITLDPKVAKKLIRLLNLYQVSPMCLEMFVEDFIAKNACSNKFH